MSTLDDFAQNVDMRVALREPFEPHQIKQIPKGNRTEDYVSHAVVTDRLNAECPGWTMSEPQWITDDQGHVSGVLCSMTIGTVTRWEVGDVDSRSKPGAEAKIAMSDWIKRAAMRFGVGLDLWARSDEMAVRRPEAASRGEAVSQTAEGRRPEAEVSAEGLRAGAGSAPAGPLPLPLDEPELPATPEQWERLMHVTKGSKVKALKLINLANGVNYASSTMDGATRQEVSLAITKGTE